MRKELFERDDLVLAMHGFLELGESLAQSLIPFQFAVVNEDAAEESSHRLGVRTDVELVRSGDLFGFATSADAGDTNSDGLAVVDDGRSHAWDGMLLDYGPKELRNVLRRRSGDWGECEGEYGQDGK
jgi:hypothetical protein